MSENERENELLRMTFTELLGRAEYAFVMYLDEQKSMQEELLSLFPGLSREVRIKPPSHSPDVSCQPPTPNSNTSQFALVAVIFVMLCDLNKTKS